MANPARPQQPDPQQDGISLRKFVGVVNVVDPERLGPDELELAINVDLDDRGQIHRRRGYALAAAGSYSSLFTSNRGTVYGVVNGAFGIINHDLSFVSLASGFANAVVCYVQVGSNIYYSTGLSGLSGIIDERTGTIGPWGSNPDYWFSPVVNPTATLGPVAGRLLGKPPCATSLAYYNGRIYLAQGKTLWATALYLYNYVDKTQSFVQFEDDIVMLGVVTDGIYVGTPEGVYFLSGSSFPLKRTRVMDTGAIPGSMVYIPGELANPPQVGLDQDTPAQVSILFMTASGYCIGKDGGVCSNETEDKVVFPGASSASAMYRFQDGVHSYVSVLNSGGTPQANTRIGDYVDAELIPAGSWRVNDDCLSFTDSFEATIVT